MTELFGSITPTDMANAQSYASNKLLREKTLSYTPIGLITWKNKDPSGLVSYRCPTGLTCYEGIPVIANSKECQEKNHYNSSVSPGPRTGWPLFWGTDNQCHLSNYMLHQGCDTSFSKKGHLDWDDNTQACYTTRSYCKDNGYDEYSPGVGIPGKPEDGGSCNLSTGMSVVDAIFGNTITRGIVGGACFK